MAFPSTNRNVLKVLREKSQFFFFFKPTTILLLLISFLKHFLKMELIVISISASVLHLDLCRPNLFHLAEFYKHSLKWVVLEDYDVRMSYGLCSNYTLLGEAQTEHIRIRYFSILSFLKASDNANGMVSSYSMSNFRENCTELTAKLSDSLKDGERSRNIQRE